MRPLPAALRLNLFAMKFIQVHYFNDLYLERFYSTRPELTNSKWDKQITEIFHDGFSCGHLFAHALANLGYESQLIIANCAPAQIHWALEHDYKVQDVHSWIYEITRAQIDYYQPEILYLSHPIEFDHRFIRTLKAKPAFIAGWRAADIYDHNDFSDFDLMLSNVESTRELLKKHGAKAVEHFFPAVPEFISKSLENVEKLYDVVFVGQWSNLHRQRNEMLLSVAQLALKSSKSFSLAYFLTVPKGLSLPPEVAHFNLGERWGMEMFRACKLGKIVLNGVVDYAKGQAGNMRQFEVTGVGSFLLTPHHSSLHEHFEPGYEIETYCSLGELHSKIYHYLENEEAREAIATRGHQRCMSEHSMTTRAKELHSLIMRYRSPSPSKPTSLRDNDSHTQQSVPSPPETQEVSQNINSLIDNALRFLDQEDAERALEFILQAKAYRKSVKDLHFLHALALLKLGRMQEGIAMLEFEIAEYPENSQATQLIKTLNP